MAVWNSVTEKARGKGHLVYAMDQALTPGFAQCPQGYCVGLAVRWVHHRFRLGDYAFDAGRQELNNPDREAVDLQRTYDQALAGNGHLWSSIDKVLFAARLKRFDGRCQETNQDLSSSGIFNMLERGSAGLSRGGDGIYLVGMAGGGGSHCIAISNEAETWWRLFDANYGHFRMKGNALFTDFLTSFLSTKGSGYGNKYRAGWATIGIKPWWAS